MGAYNPPDDNKDYADTIIGNCDSQIFLGGSEQTTLKDLKCKKVMLHPMDRQKD
jgi:hypothetical protein